MTVAVQALLKQAKRLTLEERPELVEPSPGREGGEDADLEEVWDRSDNHCFHELLLPRG